MSLFWSCSDQPSGTNVRDNGIPTWRQLMAPHREEVPKQRFSAWPCLCRPYARQPTGNARNARLLLDRRSCSTYWLLVGRATGTMSKMSSHTIGTRHLWLLPWKNERFTLGTLASPETPLMPRERCCTGWHPNIFEQEGMGSVSRAKERVSPRTQPGCPIRGDLSGLLLAFPTVVSCLIPVLSWL